MFKFLIRYSNAIMSFFQWIFLGKSARALKLRYDMLEVASKAAGKELVANTVAKGDTLAKTAGKTIIDVLEQSNKEEQVKIIEAIDKDNKYLKDVSLAMSKDAQELYLTYKGFGISIDLKTRKILPRISF